MINIEMPTTPMTEVEARQTIFSVVFHELFCHTCRAAPACCPTRLAYVQVLIEDPVGHRMFFGEEPRRPDE